jgi:hypothetical protein
VYIPKVKSVYIVSKLVCILLAKWCVGIGDLINALIQLLGKALRRTHDLLL